MKAIGIDHIVLTVDSLAETIEFYTRVLKLEAFSFGEGRKALRLGHQKINLHQRGREFLPNARLATPGSADICLIYDGGIDAIMEHLTQNGTPIEVGPVPRTGAMGPIRSVYVRDPDLNLVELAVYVGTE